MLFFIAILIGVICRLLTVVVVTTCKIRENIEIYGAYQPQIWRIAPLLRRIIYFARKTYHNRLAYWADFLNFALHTTSFNVRLTLHNWRGGEYIPAYPTKSSSILLPQFKHLLFPVKCLHLPLSFSFLSQAFSVFQDVLSYCSLYSLSTAHYSCAIQRNQYPTNH